MIVQRGNGKLVKKVKLENVGSFNYFAKIDGLCENEHDNLLIGEYDGEVSLNPEVGYEYKWMNKKELIEDIEANPQKYTPWVTEGVKILKKMSLG